VDVIVSNGKKEDELQAGVDIYEELRSNGIDTILDDRKKERFGFKMGDFELIGFPYAVVVGKKLQEGLVEIVCRKSGEKADLKKEDVVKAIKRLYNEHLSLHRVVKQIDEV